MIALAILGIGLSVLISTASKCLAVVKQSRNYETARHLLAIVELKFQNHLLELTEGQTLQDGSEQITFEAPYYQYKGTWAVETIGKEEDGLRQVTFRVAWSDRGDTPYEEVTTYLYMPEKPEGGTVVSQ
jgi:hypothetical protein